MTFDRHDNLAVTLQQFPHQTETNDVIPQAKRRTQQQEHSGRAIPGWKPNSFQRAAAEVFMKRLKGRMISFAAFIEGFTDEFITGAPGGEWFMIEELIMNNAIVANDLIHGVA